MMKHKNQTKQQIRRFALIVCVLLSCTGKYRNPCVFSDVTVFCDTAVQQLWQDKLQCVPVQGCSCSPETGSTVPLKWGILVLVVDSASDWIEVGCPLWGTRCKGFQYLNQPHFEVFLFINLLTLVTGGTS